jgi:hypothetical protein
MQQFNNGKDYHGSDAVAGGKLQGATANTDYFYLFCPKCPDKRILQILDYGVHARPAEHPYKDHVKKQPERAFTLVFTIHCEQCKFTDFMKISNTGWQGGKYSDWMERFAGTNA